MERMTQRLCNASIGYTDEMLFSAPVNYRYTRESYEGCPRKDSHSAVRTEILNLVQSIQVGIRLSNLSHRES